MWKGTAVVRLAHYRDMCVDGLRNTGTNLRRVWRSKGQDFNSGPPDYEARMLSSTHDACVKKIFRSIVAINFIIRRDCYDCLYIYAHVRYIKQVTPTSLGCLVTTI